ncbi:pilus assembly protein TadG-related protein, partial [Fulvimarina sp. 2208YS6-2-32]
MSTSLSRHLGRYRLAKGGNVAFIFALVLPILVTAVGGAVDYGAFAMRKGSSQHAAVDFQAELTRVFHREVTRLQFTLRGSCLGQGMCVLLLRAVD